MKKVYIVRPALYFAREFIRENSREIQGVILMISLWAMGFITGICVCLLKLK